MTSEVEMAASEPPAVLPAQMSRGVCWDADTSGPRGLMLAVLEDAVRCLEHGRRRGHFHARCLATEADAWVRSDHRGWPFSFVNICEVLGFDADAVRSRLLTRPRGAAHGRRTRVIVRVRSAIRSRGVITSPERRGSGLLASSGVART
jgi:hypothetical protein